MPHGPRGAATIDRIERTADDVLLPLVGNTVRQLLEIPAPVQGVALEGEGLAFGACKRSEDGEWLVLRCINLLDAEVAGRWRLPWTPAAVRRSRLDETVGDALATTGDEVAFTAAPRGAVTLLLR
jgi:hypothetical protein